MAKSIIKLRIVPILPSGDPIKDVELNVEDQTLIFFALVSHITGNPGEMSWITVTYEGGSERTFFRQWDGEIRNTRGREVTFLEAWNGEVITGKDREVTCLEALKLPSMIVKRKKRNHKALC